MFHSVNKLCRESVSRRHWKLTADNPPQLWFQRICKYLEKGIYTVYMFPERNSVLAREIKIRKSGEAALQKR